MAHEQDQENQIPSQSLQDVLAHKLAHRQERIFGEKVQNVQDTKQNKKNKANQEEENITVSQATRLEIKTDLLQEIQNFNNKKLKKTEINAHKVNQAQPFLEGSKIESMLEAVQSRHQESHSFSDDMNWDDNSVEPSSPKANLIEPKVKPTQQPTIQKSHASPPEVLASFSAPVAPISPPKVILEKKLSNFAKARQKIETFIMNVLKGKTTQEASNTPVTTQSTDSANRTNQESNSAKGQNSMDDNQPKPVTTQSIDSANVTNQESNSTQVQDKMDDDQPKKVKDLIEQFNNTPNHPYARLPENKKVFNKNKPQVQASTESTSPAAVEENYQRKPVKELINQFNNTKDHTYAGYVHVAGATANNRTPIINVANNTPAVPVSSSIQATASSQPPVVDNGVELASIPPLEEASLVNQNRSISQQIAEDEALAKQLQAKEIAASLSDSYNQEAQNKADEIYARQVHDELNNHASVATSATKVEPAQSQPVIEEPDNTETLMDTSNKKSQIKADEIHARQVQDELNNHASVATPVTKVEPAQPQPIIEEPDDGVTSNKALDRKPKIDTHRQMNEYSSSQSRPRITVIEFQSLVLIPVFTSILRTKLSLDVAGLCVNTMVTVMAAWIPVVVARQQIIIISEDNNRISAGSCRQQYQQSTSTPIITEVDDNDINASSTPRRGPGISAC